NAELALASEKAAHTESNGHSLWIDLTEDGRKKAHKKTILRTLMDPTFDINDNKSHDRLLRVRYYSIGGDSWDRTASTVYSKSTSEDHLLKIQGLFASLVCFNGSKTSLAILQCTGIKIVNTHPITYLEAAPSAEISLPDTRYEVTGQILSLVPFDESNNSSGRISWAWIAQYVAFDSAKAKQASAAELPSRMRHLSVTVDGRLVLPLKSSDLKELTLEEILNIPRPADKESEKTWVFSNEQLEVFGRILCERVTEDAVRMKIPVYGAVKDGRYPYEATISHCFNFIVAPAPKDGRRPCGVCLKNVAGSERQNHMGRHILLSQRGVIEPEIVMEVAKDYPCGFCGKEMSENGCSISIASALKSSTTKPSTNAPLKCSLCTETHWKYNMPKHLQDRHPSWKVSVPLPDRDVLASAISISQEEEARMKITHSQQE
ncbi:hypothetical protein R3P38DRAFT_2406960, partial [Favolaschia claudopus]